MTRLGFLAASRTTIRDGALIGCAARGAFGHPACSLTSCSLAIAPRQVLYDDGDSRTYPRLCEQQWEVVREGLRSTHGDPAKAPQRMLQGRRALAERAQRGEPREAEMLAFEVEMEDAGAAQAAGSSAPPRGGLSEAQKEQLLAKVQELRHAGEKTERLVLFGWTLWYTPRAICHSVTKGDFYVISPSGQHVRSMAQLKEALGLLAASEVAETKTSEEALPEARCVCQSEGAELVGRRVRMWWEGEQAWYSGRVDEYDERWQLHRVRSAAHKATDTPTSRAIHAAPALAASRVATPALAASRVATPSSIVYQVAYDDGESKKHKLTGDECEAGWELLPLEVECEAGWEALKLRCIISHLPLTDPARSERCSHSAHCNYEQLKQHVARHRACPLSGCASGTVSSREVVRDAALRAKLLALPKGTRTVWRRGDELCVTAPPAEAAARPPKRMHPAGRTDWQRERKTISLE